MVNRCLTVIILILISALCPLLKVHAQASFPELERNSRLEANQSPLDTTMSMRPDALENEDNFNVRRFTRNPKTWCDGVECEGFVPTPILGSQQHALNIPAPMAAVTDTVMSQNQAIQLSKMLVGPLALYNTTLQLTEPGIAGAMQNTMNQAYASVNNRMMADVRLMQELEINPDVKETLGRQYFECVNYWIKNAGNSLSTASDPNRDYTTWIEAQSICMADRTDDITTAYPSSGVNFDSEGALAGQGGFTYSYDKSHPVLFGGTDQPINKILLSDYLFNRVGGYTSGQNKELKASFQHDIGDFLFEVDWPSDGYRVSASRQIKVSKLPAAQSPELWYRNRVDFVWNYIHLILHAQCTDYLATMNSEDVPVFDGSVFWVSNNPVLRKWMTEVSIKGWRYNPMVGDMLFALFQNEVGGIEGYDASLCSQRLQPGVQLASISYLMANKNLISDRHRAVFALSKRIALGQILGTLLEVQQLLNDLADSYFDNFVKKYAVNLLTEVAGTSDIVTAYASNLDQMQEHIEAIRKARMRESGNKAKQSADIVKAGLQNGSAGSSMSPQTE